MKAVPVPVAGARLVVQQLISGVTVLEFMRDRLELVGPGQALPAPPDVVLAPIKKGYLDFSEPEFDLGSTLKKRIRSGRAILVIDCAREGVVHDKNRSKPLHRYLTRHRLPPEHCVYITQDRSYRAAYEEFCRERGWTPVKVLTHDYFIRLLFSKAGRTGGEVYKARLDAFRQRSARRDKRFVCLNFSPRWNKVLLLLQLMEEGLWDQGYISFGGFSRRGVRHVQRDKMRRQLVAAQGFEDIAPALADAHLEQLDAYGQVLLGHVPLSMGARGFPKTPYLDYGMPEHDRSWFTIVTETEIEGPRRVTEKPFKALLGFHPFILFGNAGSLSLIRELGFQTFSGFIDERYDDEPDPRRRFEMVMAEIRRLCSLDELELRRMERELKPVLAHNALWGLTRLPAIWREQKDPAFLDELLARPQRTAAA